MAMAKMAGDADSESGCDDKERVQRAASTLGEGRGEGKEPRRKELDEVGSRGAKKGRCAARNAPTKWTAGHEISFVQRS